MGKIGRKGKIFFYKNPHAEYKHSVSYITAWHKFLENQFLGKVKFIKAISRMHTDRLSSETKIELQPSGSKPVYLIN